jgi:hypothetical protein
MKLWRKLDIDFSPVSVLNYLKSLPNKTSSNSERIPQIALKMCAIPLALPLSIIFQESFNSGVIPKQWNESVIVPVYKKGSRSDPKNYRPISLTSTICRIMEKMLCDSIRNRYLRHFDNVQFGFLKGRSCNLSLLKSVSAWQKDLKKRQYVDVIYFDFQSAFDKIPFEKLLLKLQTLGMDERAIKWFTVFLTSRTSKVRINGILSESSINVGSGVPQGTVSGPLLFLLYINDLYSCIDSSVEYTLFADDLKIFGKDPKCLQSTINKIVDWSKFWDLPISIPKTSVLHLGSNNPRNTYRILNDPIVESTIVRDLGLFVDEKLAFEFHVDNKVLKANILCKNILRSFQFHDPSKYIDLYRIYVRPILEYCSEVYCPVSNSRLSNSLEQPLRSLSRAVFKRCHIPMCSYPDRLAYFNIPSQLDRRIHCDLSLCFKLLFGLVYVIDCPLKLSESARHPLRLICQSNDYKSANFFFNRVQYYWNQVAVEFDNRSVPFNSFKVIVKEHRFTCNLPECLR